MTDPNGKLLNEQKYQKTKSKLKTIGFILLGVGIALCIVGIVLLVFAFKSMKDTSTNSALFGIGTVICLFVGVCLTMRGIMLLLIAHQREIIAYNATSVAPVASETTNYMADETAPAVQKVASAISKGIKGEEGIKEGEYNKEAVKYCTECGAKNALGSKFCSQCGNKLTKD